MSEDRTSRGVEHLQAAALEMIGAARAFLDAVEDVVSDPEKVAEVVAVVESVAEAAVRAAAPRPAAGPDVAEPVDPPGREARPRRGSVEPIRVS